MFSNKINKFTVTIIFILLSTIIFLIKLPKVFHFWDKELHALFYALASILLNYIYRKNRIILGMILFFFGILIELFQEYSNNISIKLLGRRIHGNFDVEDVLFNFIGILWGYIVILSFNIIKKSR